MSDADLTQYNGTSAFPSTADVGTNADQFLVPTDDKVITALSNIAGEAPVRRSLDRLKDYYLGIRGAIIGDFVGAVRKTLKSLEVDGTGGATSTAAAGTIVPSATRSGTTLPTTANPPGVITKDSPVFGYAVFSWNGAAYVFQAGFNVDSYTNPAVGTVVVSFASAPADYQRAAAVATGYFNSGAVFVSEALPAAPVAGKMPVTVYIRSTAGGGAINGGFTLVVHCGA